MLTENNVEGVMNMVNMSVITMAAMSLKGVKAKFLYARCDVWTGADRQELLSDSLQSKVSPMEGDE